MHTHATPPEALSRIRAAVDTHGVKPIAEAAKVNKQTVIRATAGLGVLRASLAAMLSAIETLDRSGRAGAAQ